MWWGIYIRHCYKFPAESNSERILKIGQYLLKLWARVKCLVFLTHGVVVICSTLLAVPVWDNRGKPLWYQKGKTMLIVIRQEMMGFNDGRLPLSRSRGYERVRVPSVCPRMGPQQRNQCCTAGLLLWARQAGDID